MQDWDAYVAMTSMCTYTDAYVQPHIDEPGFHRKEEVPIERFSNGYSFSLQKQPANQTNRKQQQQPCFLCFDSPVRLGFTGRLQPCERHKLNELHSKRRAQHKVQGFLALLLVSLPGWGVIESSVRFRGSYAVKKLAKKEDPHDCFQVQAQRLNDERL